MRVPSANRNLDVLRDSCARFPTVVEIMDSTRRRNVHRNGNEKSEVFYLFSRPISSTFFARNVYGISYCIYSPRLPSIVEYIFGTYAANKYEKSASARTRSRRISRERFTFCCNVPPDRTTSNEPKSIPALHGPGRRVFVFRSDARQSCPTEIKPRYTPSCYR